MNGVSLQRLLRIHARTPGASTLLVGAALALLLACGPVPATSEAPIDLSVDATAPTELGAATGRSSAPSGGAGGSGSSIGVTDAVQPAAMTATAGAAGMFAGAAGAAGAARMSTGAAGAAGVSAGVGAAGSGGAVSMAEVAGSGGRGQSMPNAGSGALKPLTVWIAGDSTVMTYTAANQASSGAALEGWGQELPQFLDPQASVNNQAIGGRSTGTFMYDVTCDANGKQTVDKSVTPRQWGAIKSGIQPGDYLLIQFGHNDEADPTVAAYCARHADIPQYKQNLGDMADTIIALNATPIFVTPVSRLSYRNGEFAATLTDYAAAMKEAAQIKGITVIDLNSMSVELYRKLGDEKVRDEIFEPGGNTHFQKQGAIELARLVSEGIAASGSGLAPYAQR